MGNESRKRRKVIDLAESDEEVDAIFVSDSDSDDEGDEGEVEGAADYIYIDSSDGDAAGGEKPGTKKHPKKATLSVHIHDSDIPSAPGGRAGKDNECSQASDSKITEDGAGSGCDPERLAKIKSRIAKILDRGLHPNTPEHEAQKSMRLAQKMLAKFNLSQAYVMAERDGLADEGALQGGMVTTEVRRVWQDEDGNEQFEACGLVAVWMKSLATAVSDNFDVKYYTQIRSRIPRLCRFVFYGLRTNSQLAAYSFKIALQRISLMQMSYHPPSGEFEEKRSRGATQCHSKGSYTRIARLNYCDGLTYGLQQAVIQGRLEREREQAERLAKARRRTQGNSKNKTRREHSQDGDEKVEEGTEEAIDLKQARLHLEELERTEKAAKALVIHTENVAERVIKEKGVKLKTPRYSKYYYFLLTCYYFFYYYYCCCHYKNYYLHYYY